MPTRIVVAIVAGFAIVVAAGVALGLLVSVPETRPESAGQSNHVAQPDHVAQLDARIVALERTVADLVADRERQRAAEDEAAQREDNRRAEFNRLANEAEAKTAAQLKADAEREYQLLSRNDKFQVDRLRKALTLGLEKMSEQDLVAMHRHIRLYDVPRRAYLEALGRFGDRRGALNHVKELNLQDENQILLIRATYALLRPNEEIIALRAAAAYAAGKNVSDFVGDDFPRRYPDLFPPKR